MSEYQIQEDQYAFPYHHIPTFDETGAVTLHRSLNWGFEYMCYLLHIQALITDLSPSSVLDVGCGDGRLLGLQPGNFQKVGIDLSETAIRFARAFHPEGEYYVRDAADLTETYDVVVAMEVLEHIADEGVGAFIRTLEARTEPRGHVIISVPTTAVAKNVKHYRHYDLDLFLAQLQSSGANLSVQSVEYVYRNTKVIRAYRRISESRYWYLDIYWLRRALWRYTWSRLRNANPSNGRHMVALLRRELP